MVPGKQLRLRVVTATNLEYAQARKVLAGTWSLVTQCGIAAAIDSKPIPGSAVSCGLAGALRDDLPTGTVLIPSEVQRPDATVLRCDPALTAQLRAAAMRLQFDVCEDPLVTSSTLVRGADRAFWAASGFAGVDMETGLLRADRLACVRVVLDTPGHEISEAWLNGLGALATPSAWRDLPFLINNGPRCARRAAEVIRDMLLAER